MDHHVAIQRMIGNGGMRDVRSNGYRHRTFDAVNTMKTMPNRNESN